MKWHLSVSKGHKLPVMETRKNKNKKDLLEMLIHHQEHVLVTDFNKNRGEKSSVPYPSWW